MANEAVGALNFWEQWLYVLAVTAALTLLTWRGLDVNGAACVALAVFGVLPFVAFVLIGLPRVDPHNWFLGPRIAAEPAADPADPTDGAAGYVDGGMGDVQWRSLLNVLFWNMNYYDSASAFSGDCEAPATTFPKAMAIAVAAVTLTYVLPLAVATGADPRADYCDGCFVPIASRLAGPWLGAWITLAAVTSCAGQFVAEMASDSFQVSHEARDAQGAGLRVRAWLRTQLETHSQ